MAVPVPEYLKQIAKITKEKPSFIILDLICTCGCTDFYVYQNKKNPDDEKKEKELEQKLSKRPLLSLTDWVDKTDGKRYWLKRNLFGKIVVKVPAPEFAGGDWRDHNVIKIKCDKCGQEHIIFDNKKHGYDAFADEFDKKHGCYAFADEEKRECSCEAIEFSQKKFKGSKDNLAGIRIQIRNSSSLDEFLEGEEGNVSEKEHSNAFSDITIYGNVKDLNGKKVDIFSEETA